jgi:hypothetical protein
VSDPQPWQDDALERFLPKMGSFVYRRLRQARGDQYSTQVILTACAVFTHACESLRSQSSSEARMQFCGLYHR